MADNKSVVKQPVLLILALVSPWASDCAAAGIGPSSSLSSGGLGEASGDSMRGPEAPESHLGLSSLIRQTERPPPDFHPEEGCSMAGGVCLAKDECPLGQLAEPLGLCPKQRALGVECCHGLSTLERRCARRGGQCMASSHCAHNLRDSVATDCSPGQACCVLVAI